ncbi:iron uptake transporter deferrochelatase/peroxidase subunit [Aquihabitans sp. McL0605]|uniref:iron uptake transporter deferrochelatase/peroxidase subunit n=1 Tax=Aquihabitans sp. McL0605 TaxID=3415671 RepID=UPI003CF64E1D
MDTPTPPDTAPPTGAQAPRVSRRRLLGYAGAGVVAAGAVAVGGVAVSRDDGGSAEAGPGEAESYPFYGANQAGIVTPAQDRLHFAAFDVTTTSRAELVQLLKAWTAAAARMTQGDPAGTYGPVDGPYQAPPDDTGEAFGLPPSRLTITFGFGSSLFTDADGNDRFGLAAKRPKALIDLPHFPGDKLDALRSNGDLCIQACADDPQVAVHAIRNLARIAFGAAGVRWSQLGFGRTSSTSTAQSTPRNLFGFKDGTANLKAEHPKEVATHVWVGPGDDAKADWLAGGSYLVARRINMHIETWDRTSLQEQETIIGRNKGEGAPLSGGTEFTEPDFDMQGADDKPIISKTSHVRLAHPDQNAGVEMLRRGYNFTDGSDGLGRLNAGLFFLAYLRDPVKQYVPMQTTLARDDALSEYLQHTGSALFAIPPGITRKDAYIGQSLFEG